TLAFAQQPLKPLRQRRHFVRVRHEPLYRTDGELEVLESLKLMIPLVEREPLRDEILDSGRQLSRFARLLENRRKTAQRVSFTPPLLPQLFHRAFLRKYGPMLRGADSEAFTQGLEVVQL